MQILYRYFRYIGRLFPGCALFAARCKIIRAYEKPRWNKIDLQKKVHRKICVRGVTFLTGRPLFYIIFCCFLRLLPFPSDVLAEWPQ